MSKTDWYALLLMQLIIFFMWMYHFLGFFVCKKNFYLEFSQFMENLYITRLWVSMDFNNSSKYQGA